MQLKFIAYRVCLTFLIFFSTQLFALQKTPIIIDTDMAAEDWLGMLYLLEHTHADVKAITVAGTGEAHCDPGVLNAIKLVNSARHPNIPVTCGREDPGEYGHFFPMDWRISQDAFLPVPLYGPLAKPANETAAELIIKLLEDSSQKMTIVVLGPLTNIADAIQSKPDIINRIKMIYVMGGAVFHQGGNIHTVTDIPNCVSEWNLFADSVSADQVLRSGAPITLVGLDATQFVPITSTIIDYLGEVKQTPSAALFHHILTTFKEDILSQQWQFWDTLTSTVALDETLVTLENHPIEVKTMPMSVAGQTVISETGKPVRVAVFADEKRFINTLVKTLNHQL